MWLRQPEPAPGEFAGRTSDEAVRRARQELGDDAPVRCWKTRHGGMLGFFAKEAYVAGITPPAAAIEPVRTARPGRPPRPRPEPKPMRAPATTQKTPSNRSAESVSMAQLIERTSDQVTLGSDSVAEAVFSEVLAEAEAAVSRTGEHADPSPELEAVAPSPHQDSARIEGLTATLAALGVPFEFLPDDADATLDGLARSLANVPAPPPLPSLGGSVIAVVGALRDARAAARQTVEDLGLDPTDLVEVERTDAGRQRIARRRSSNKVTVLVVEASLPSRGLTDRAAWINRVGPDYVVGAVPATAKRSDVETWRARLGRIDALALSCLGDTATPGELMGVLPISHIGGSEATTLRWVLTLLQANLERGG